MSTINNVSGLVGINESHLFPILPSTIRDSRYPGTVCAPVWDSWTLFPLEPSYQSRGWTISTHPHGKHYAYTKAWAGITIVTEARVVEQGVSNQLNAWLAIIYNVVTKKRIHLPGTSHLFLEIRQDLCACNYYFVDHVLRTVFWLHPLDEVGIESPRSFSHGHHRHPLQENYWIHVELFPETASKYSELALNELHMCLLLSRAEAAPLEPLAFPFTDVQCELLIKAFESGKCNLSSPYATTYVARLLASIERHRSFIHFGEDFRLLPSETSNPSLTDSKRSLILTAVSKVFLFGLPDDHRARFEKLCADQLTFTPGWRKHVSKTAGDLGNEIARSLALLGMTQLSPAIRSGTISMALFSPFPTLAKLSLIFCVLDLVVASVLLQGQRGLVSRNSTNSALYLDDGFTSCGFQPISVVHSLPQALFLWSLILFVLQNYWIASVTMPLVAHISMFLLVTVFLLVVCVLYV
ncbi:hypothetical protein EI94DRAFT_1786391 [Lactarius quietus]|nr:hypothetical protein EI94DRAFT_1786391 [Lactarius quietus]